MSVSRCLPHTTSTRIVRQYTTFPMSKYLFGIFLSNFKMISYFFGRTTFLERTKQNDSNSHTTNILMRSKCSLLVIDNKLFLTCFTPVDADQQQHGDQQNDEDRDSRGDVQPSPGS